MGSKPLVLLAFHWIRFNLVNVSHIFGEPKLDGVYPVWWPKEYWVLAIHWLCFCLASLVCCWNSSLSEKPDMLTRVSECAGPSQQSCFPGSHSPPRPVARGKNTHLSLWNVTGFVRVHSTSLSKPQSAVLECVSYSHNRMPHANVMGIDFISSSRSLIKVLNKTGPSTVLHL